jgi:hypothetical protein
MKGLDLGKKNMLFIFLFLFLFTFRQHKQLSMVAQFFKGYTSLEVSYAAKGGRNGPYSSNWFSIFQKRFYHPVFLI